MRGLLYRVGPTDPPRVVMAGNDDANDRNTQELFDLVIEETTRSILEAVDGEALSAKELADRCDVSGPTMYRRVNAMREFDLLRTSTEIDPDGNHYTVYESNVDRVQIELDPGDEGVIVDVSYRNRTDQFIHLWEGLREQ